MPITLFRRVNIYKQKVIIYNHAPKKEEQTVSLPNTTKAKIAASTHTTTSNSATKRRY